MTPEGRVKARVKGILKAAGAYWFMPVQRGFGSPSLDFLVCYRGRFIGIETKRPGEPNPTSRQRLTMNEMAAAGAITLLVNGDDDYAQLKTTLEKIDNELDA